MKLVLERSCKLVLITNGKSHMGFRGVPKSVTFTTLNCTVAVILLYCVILPYSIAYRPFQFMSKWQVVEDRPVLSAKKMWSKESNFSNI